MFPNRFFPAGYYDHSYWPPETVVVPPVTPSTDPGGPGKHRRRGIRLREHSNQRPIWLRKRLGLWRT